MIITLLATLTAAYAGYKTHQFLSSDAEKAIHAPQVYRHYRGGLYHLLHRNVALEAAGPEPTYVIYQSIADGQLWIRPAKEFDGLVNYEGNDVPRFSQYFGAPLNAQ